MKIKIVHQTAYRYDAPVPYALQRLRLTPKSRVYQSVRSWTTSVEGGVKHAEYQDQHDNHVELIGIEPNASAVTVHCEGEVETKDTAGVYGPHRGYAPMRMFRRSTALTQAGPLVRKLVKNAAGGGDDLARMHRLSDFVRDQVRYETGATHSASTAEHALETGAGVCQDHAHIFVSAARLMGYAARYVGGYLVIEDQEQQEAGHAWAEAYIDTLGWVGFDISNGIAPDERYVRVATGLDYADAAPISGMRFGQGKEEMTVTIEVRQL